MAQMNLTYPRLFAYSGIGGKKGKKSTPYPDYAVTG